MNGMDARTGKALAGVDHLRQSVADILFTPIGSRLCLRDYGSAIPDLIDRPVTPSLRLRVYAATAMALLKWEPRLRLLAVTLVAGAAPGAFILAIDAQRLDVLPRARVRLDIPYTARLIA
jgi:phage baseplate assembly protein W